jgi:hypothetical protein
LPTTSLAAGDLAVDSGASNTLKYWNGSAWNVPGVLPINLAGGAGVVSGVLPAANHPATTSNCSGVQFAQGLNAGMTPICATPPTFVASGASHAVGYVPDPGAGAGTTRFLREDATFAVPPTSGVSEAAIFSAVGVSSYNAVSDVSATVFLVNAHTLTRFVITLSTAPAGCATLAVVAIRDVTSATSLTTLTFVNGTATYDSGVLSIAMTAGHKFAIRTTTGESGCTPDAVGNAAMTYQ